MGGMMMSFTRELTMVVKDAPMMTPIARSTTLPRTANFLNSVNRDMDRGPFWIGLRLVARGLVNKPPRHCQIGRGQHHSQQGAQIIGDEVAPFSVAAHQRLEEFERSAQRHNPQKH